MNDTHIAAVADGYRRLLCRAMETEIRLELKARAEAEAIRIFADNLRELLRISLSMRKSGPFETQKSAGGGTPLN